MAKSCWFHDEGLLQLRVLRLGLIQDGDAGVGVFPECDEIRVRWLGGLPERGWGSPSQRTGRSGYSGDTRPKYRKAAGGFPFIVVTVKCSKAKQVKARPLA